MYFLFAIMSFNLGKQNLIYVECVLIKGFDFADFFVSKKC